MEMNGNLGDDSTRAELRSLPYYHPNITGSEPVKNVLRHCSSGSYLLRNCGQHRGICAVSVVDQTLTSTKIRHFAVNGAKGEYYIQEKLAFPSLQSLIDYYRVHEVPNSQAIKDVRLVNPIYSGEVEDPPYHYACHEVDRTNALISILQRQPHLDIDDDDDDETSSSSKWCECGLRVGEVELPDGWTVHKSDVHSKLFYQNESGDSTWELPLGIRQKISSGTRAALHQLEQREFHSR